MGNNYIHANSRIGDVVIIHPQAVVGVEGFGFIPDEEGENVAFPHVGGTIIENHVVIGSGTTVCRGTLGNTVIGENTKIDNLCHIAHNVQIGRNCMVVALAMIAGSVKVGANSWVGPSVSVVDRIDIGEGAQLSIGSMVSKSVEAGQRVTGYFAQDHRAFMKAHLKMFRQK